MPYKTCPSCQRASYSSAADGTWLCPCCGEDMSNAAAEDYFADENTAARPSIRLLRGVELSSLQQFSNGDRPDESDKVM